MKRYSKKYLFWPCTDHNSFAHCWKIKKSIKQIFFSNFLYADCSLKYEEGFCKFSRKYRFFGIEFLKIYRISRNAQSPVSHLPSLVSHLSFPFLVSLLLSLVSCLSLVLSILSSSLTSRLLSSLPLILHPLPSWNTTSGQRVMLTSLKQVLRPEN